MKSTEGVIFLSLGIYIILSAIVVSLQIPEKTLLIPDVIKKSVSLARSSVRKCGKPDGYVLVGGSIGPYGACQHDGSEYTGAYIQQE